MPATVSGVRSITEMVTMLGGDSSVTWTPYPHQIPPPGDWRTWCIRGGRGSGKTEAAARMVHDHLEELGSRARVGIGAPIIPAARNICMEGESGLYSLFRDSFVTYNRTMSEARHKGGGYVYFTGTEEPDRWNGPQWTMLWFDELALCNPDSWWQAQLGLRLGSQPRAIATYTPKRAKRRFIEEVEGSPDTVLTTGSTYDNPKLSESTLSYFEKQFGRGMLGRQELYAEDIEEAEGALWQRAWLESRSPAPETLKRIVVGVDPAVTGNKDSDETGIIVAGMGEDNQIYVLGDHSLRASPSQWARSVVGAYEHFNADLIVGEVNNGGEMVELTIKTIDRSVPFRAVRASRGKAVRAEPIAAMYEDGRVTHVQEFEQLEDQMCTWTPDDKSHSPDRLDALVWALTELSKDRGNLRFRYIA